MNFSNNHLWADLVSSFYGVTKNPLENSGSIPLLSTSYNRQVFLIPTKRKPFLKAAVTIKTLQPSSVDIMVVKMIILKI